MSILVISFIQGLCTVLLSTILLFGIIRLSKNKPEWGGLLSSFPTTVALVLIFTTIFNDSISARNIALNLGSTIVLFNLWIITYYIFAKSTKRYFTIFISLIFLFIIAILYQKIGLTFYLSISFYFLVWFLGVLFFYKKIKLSKAKIKIESTPINIIIACAIYVTFIIIISKFTSPIITAILASFPTSALFGAYYNQSISNKHLTNYLGSMFISTPTISLFCIVVSFTKSINIIFSFIIGFLVAISISLLFSRLVSKLQDNEL